MPIDSKNIHYEINKLLSEEIEIEFDEISEDLHIDNTPSWDSFGHLRLVVGIESKFNVQLKPSEIQSMLDYQSVFSIVERFINK